LGVRRRDTVLKRRVKEILKSYLPQFVVRFFTEGAIRSLKAKKNIAASFLLGGVSVLISFALVPLVLHYLNPMRYGVWLTLSSVIGFFNFFDIGLGNGLRNKFAEALAKGDHLLARTYLSTTYLMLIIIFGLFLFLFMFINPFLNWTVILNTPEDLAAELTILAYIVVAFFSLRFVFKLVGIVLVADQKPAVNNSFEPISNLIAFIIVFVLTKTTAGSLLYLGAALSLAPVVVLICASFIFYNGSYKEFRPGLRFVDFHHAKELTAIGVQFFIIQIAVVVIFYTDNVIIAQILGPEEVTPYNIAFKYFSLITMVFVTIVTPFWSAYTEAYAKGDTVWIKASTKKLIHVWLLLFIPVIFMIAVSKGFYLFWVGEEVKVPLILSLFMGLFVMICTWNDIFSYFINGTGKIRLQLHYSIIAALLNIPLSIYFAKTLKLGSPGVILATCVCLLFGSFFGPLQYAKIINNRAEGIWAK